MKTLIEFVPTYIQDSDQVISELRALGPLPPSARLFTLDAKAMYTNLNTKECVNCFQEFITLLGTSLPKNFPKEMFIAVLEIVMTSNIFTFDDTHWLQTNGTAMGTSSACLYSMISIGFIELTKILPRFRPNLLYYKRFIDDKLGIWTGSTNEFNSYRKFVDNSSALDWTSDGLQRSVIFLDLEISIDPISRCLLFKTYMKPTNLFLYIPPTSAHPLGVLKSVIYGNLQRYWRQNSEPSAFASLALGFKQHLRNRGHDDNTLNAIFMDASRNIDKKSLLRLVSQKPRRKTTVKSNPSDTLFLKVPFHPRGLDRQAIRRVHDTHLRNIQGYSRMIVAFKRGRNLRDLLIPNRLSQPDGKRASNSIISLTGHCTEP